ncbi:MULTISPECIES: ABC transporter permease [unclassified Oceanispirochaeta]|uniref:ABC transporter permease n=1 Tax=unclassified Oceanispirochaeta TaxID=2635722 RepID=UPI000E09DD1B|nr:MULTISPECIES: ABC transporter permease subunit [unclassified Oceanispirochaeta]MBF9016001.1 ABC transporter permease subunit [Oceanispirochaeta sp. M2]NPD72464.1 ABC transporter permease subunit [Oceanispirochaeta sp. M1]RDG31923.1 ABC transporter permease subunit [Oceanispirochaeta sp. M1]
MNKYTKRKIIELSISSATVLAIFILWFIVAELKIFPEYFIPAPSSVLDAFLEISVSGYRGGTLLQHLGDSLFRVVSGFIFACFIAVPLGMFMGYNWKVKAIFDPIVEFYRPLPPLAYYTILVIWLGIGNESKITLLFLAAFPPLSISAMSAVAAVPMERIQTAQSLGASKLKIFSHVVFPSCMPGIFTGMRVSIGFTYTTLVSSEIVAATSGIGWMVLDAGKFLRGDVMFMGIFVMGITGIILDRLIRIAERLIIPWKGKG